MIKYALTSLVNTGVLTITNNILVANYLIEGIGDCFVKSVAKNNSHDYDKLTLEYIRNNNFLLDSVYSIQQLNEVDEFFLITKELVKYRQQLFNILLIWNDNLISRTNKFISSDFIQYAMLAVKESDPLNDKWHRWVLEHASIQDMPIREAYQDLKLIADCDPEIRFRVNSLSMKWVRLINQVSLEDLKNDSYRSDLTSKIYADYWGIKQI